MALSWASIVARALKKLSATSGASHWDSAAGNANLTAIAKEIEREFIRATDYFVQETNSNIVSGTASYNKPTGCLKIHDVFVGGEQVTEQNGAEVLDYYGEDWTAETGTPIMYLQRGTTILLIPIPDENTTNGLTIINTYLPTQDSTNASVADECLEVLADGVAGMALWEDPSNINLAPLFFNEDPMRPGKFQKGCDTYKKSLRSKSRKRQFRFNTPITLNAYMDQY